MITIIDVVLALLFAWFMLNLFFIPFFGPVLAYGMYELWLQYCIYRKTNK